MKRSWIALVGLSIVTALPLRPATLSAQRTGDTTAVEARRSMVTRAELQAALEEIQRNLSSTVYSQSLRSAKQSEANTIRERLAEGDLRSGDEIKLDILQEPGLNGTYTVTPARTIVLPGNYEIQMRGVLRSEVQSYLTTQMKKYVNDAYVHATASVRIAIFGGIGHPGFYNVPADKLLSKVLQDEGGGVANNVKLTKSQILRDGQVVIDGTEFNDAVYKGRTLDQLNIQAGDVIQVALKPTSGLFWRIVAAVSGLGGLIYLAIQITR